MPIGRAAEKFPLSHGGGRWNAKTAPDIFCTLVIECDALLDETASQLALTLAGPTGPHGRL